MCGKNGTVLFFNDENIGFLALPCTMSGRFNVYNIPIQRRAYAVNGYQATRNDTNSVIIYSNQLHNGMSVYNRLVQYAKDLYLIDNIIMIKADGYEFKCDDKAGTIEAVRVPQNGLSMTLRASRLIGADIDSFFDEVEKHLERHKVHILSKK